jgi:hypothetical protein
MLATLLPPAWAGVGATGAAPTPPPAPAPATRPAHDLERARQLLAQLADPDYDRREAARADLMAFPRSALPTVREAVRQSLPLAPSQLTVLRDIVNHVYLSGDVYAPDPTGAGSLGVSLPRGVRPEDRGLLTIERGVAVTGRIVGFPAYRLLQNGDVLISLEAGGGGDGARLELSGTDELLRAVRAIRPGQTVTFEVARQGRLLTIPMTLQPRPAAFDDVADMDQFAGRRYDEAEAYWQRDFAPLLDERLI